MSHTWTFASIVSNFTTATTHIVQNGDNIRFWGAVVSNASGAAVTVNFRQTGTSTEYFRIRCPASSTTAVTNRFIADKGLDVLISDASVEVAVFHGHGGA